MQKISHALSLVLAAVAMSAAGPGQAAPSVTQVSGSASAGSQITISGSGFGTKANAPKVWDTVDNVSAYGAVSSLAGKSVPVGPSYVWGTNTFDSPGAVVFSAANPRHSQQKMHYRTSRYVGYLQWPIAMGRESAPSSQNELYVSFWVRPDGSLEGEGHSSKLLRVWDDANGEGTRVSWTQMHLTSVTSGGSEITDWNSWGGTTGQWNRVELFVSGPKGVVKGWTNGRVMHNVTNFQKDGSYSGRGLNVARVGWDIGGATPPSVDLSFGDIYVDTTQARVELCSQPSWSSCMTREVQPTTSWSNNQIVFNAYPGQLSGTLYAYVVDASGAVNATGVAINGTGAPAATVPNAPTSVSVN
jgi:hypothetical protein